MKAIGERLSLMRLRLARWAAGPLVVRVLLLVSASAALALATPTSLLSARAWAAIVAGAVVVTVAPRGRLVSILLLTTTGGWLISTTAYHETVASGRLIGLAAAMYLVHTLAALASVLPYDVVLPPGVLAGWLLRAAMVILVSVGLGFLALIEAPRYTGAGFLLASIGGVITIAMLVWALTRVVRR